MPQIVVAPNETVYPPIIHERATQASRWFAVYTNSRHEKCVAKHVGERDIETFLPLYQKTHQWKKHSAVQLELPLFPNYVFVRIRPEQRTSVLGVPGVLGIVGGRVPASLPDADVEALRASVASNRFEPHPYLADGERVRIKSGAMAGIEGILVRRKNPLRVVLTIDLIQRSVAVEMDAEEVEPVSHGRMSNSIDPHLYS